MVLDSLAFPPEQQKLKATFISLAMTRNIALTQSSRFRILSQSGCNSKDICCDSIPAASQTYLLVDDKSYEDDMSE